MTCDVEELVVNIAGIGGMTRSGRLFTPLELRNDKGHRNRVTMEKANVDDMIAKSGSEEEHLINLKKLFERLRKFKLRQTQLNAPSA